MSSVIVALPNILMIKLGHSSQAILDFTVQRLTSLKLDQMSELVQAIDDVQRKVVPPGEAMQQADRILAKQHRFGMPTIVFGYVLSCIGLTLLYRPEPLALLATGATGILVGILVLSFERRPRFDLLLPVIAAFIVSTLMFTLTKTGLIEGSAILIIPPLVTFLPGAVLTTGMIELASKQILSGSARLMYGATTLFFLYIGIAAGLSLSGLPNMYVSATAASTFPWWAPAVGTLLFGIGTRKEHPMRIVVALGGNALLKRGEPMTHDVQRANIRVAAEALKPVAEQHELVLAHGNGPQVGLLALQASAYKDVEAYPLDVLGAQTEGMIGYMIEQELGNLLPFDVPFATILSMVEVDPQDPAFQNPTKFVGPVYERGRS